MVDKIIILSSNISSRRVLLVKMIITISNKINSIRTSRTSIKMSSCNSRCKMKPKDLGIMMIRQFQPLLYNSPSTSIRWLTKRVAALAVVQNLTRMSLSSTETYLPRWRHLQMRCYPITGRQSAWNCFTVDGSSGRREWLSLSKTCRKRSSRVAKVSYQWIQRPYQCWLKS